VVGEHLRAVFAKIGAANRTEAVAIAMRKNLL
jgi:DNA-binding CsgD family transcriptional regulator